MSISSRFSTRESFRLGRPKEFVPKENNLSNWEFILSTVVVLHAVHSYEHPFIKNDRSDSGSIYHRLIADAFVGIPILYLQFFFGQYSELGATKIGELCPLVRGLNASFLLTIVLRLLNFGFLQADLFMYLLLSLEKKLPWSYCPEKYTENCWSPLQACTSPCINESIAISSLTFWNYIYMNNPDSEGLILSLDDFSWHRIVTLLVSWGVMILITVNFSRFYRQLVTYSSFIGVILVLLICGICFVGKRSTDGIKNLFSVDFESFIKYNAWSKAIGNTITFISVGSAIHLSRGMLLLPHSSTEYVSLMCMLFSIIISILSTMSLYMASATLAHQAAVPDNIDYLFSNNTAIILTIIPASYTILSASQLWCILYFATCSLIVMINQLMYLYVFETSILQTFPRMNRYRSYFILSLVLGVAIVSIPFVSSDFYGLTIIFKRKCLRSADVLNTFLFVSAVCYIYGVQKICDDVHFFMGTQPAILWKIAWYFLPILTGFPLWYHMFKEQFSNKNDMIYYILVIGLLGLILVIEGIVEIINSAQKNNLIGIFKPKERWGPADPEERYLRRKFNPRQEIRSRRRREICMHNCLLSSDIIKEFMKREQKLRDNLEKDKFS